MMKKGNNKIIILTIDVLILCFCIFGLLQIKEKAGLPLNITHTQNGLIVGEIYEKKYNDYFLLDDKIIAIEGKRVSTIEAVEFVLDGKRIGDTIAISIEKTGLTRLELVPTSAFYTTRYSIIATLIGLLFFIIGVVVYIKKPEEKAASVFHWTTIGVALLIMTSWGRYTIEPFGSGIAVRFVFNMAYALLPLLFLHFTVVFPVDKFIGKKTIFGVLYAVAVLLIVGMNVTFIVAALQESMEWFTRYLTLFTSTRLFFIACIVAALSNLIYTYRHYANLSDKKKIRWILFGLIVGIFPFILLWVIPQMIISQGLIDEEFIILFSSVIPFTFAISIVRYKILDIDVLINRSIVYTMIMLLLLSFYATFLSLSILLIGFLTPQASIITSIGVVVLFVFIFEPIRTATQKFVDRRFFRVQYDYRLAVHQFFEDIKNSLTIPLLAELVTDRIIHLMPVERSAFATLIPEANKFYIHKQSNFTSLEEIINEVGLDTETNGYDYPLSTGEMIDPGIHFSHYQKDVLSKLGVAIIFPMSSKDNKILGYLFLGKKKSGRKYSVEDIELLGAVASHTSLAIERLKLQEAVIYEQTENQRLAELNEIKSLFVSSVSHDLKTPLTSIRMFTELLKNKRKLNPEKEREYLDIIEGESERLTRFINNVLDFAKIEKGIKDYHFEEIEISSLIKSVLKMLSYQFKVGKYKISTNIPDHEIFINADGDAIMEAVVNLLSNSMKYSLQDRTIDISLIDSQDYVQIKIKDYGVGIAKEKIDKIFEPYTRAIDASAKIKGTGLGLSIVKHIVDAHKGRILVNSTLGKGSEFVIELPKIQQMEEV